MEQSTSITATQRRATGRSVLIYDEMLQYLPCRKYPEGATRQIVENVGSLQF